MPPGRIIALSGRRARPRFSGPAFIRPLLNVLYEVETFDVVKVRKGIRPRSPLAMALPCGRHVNLALIPTTAQSMLEAQTFIEKGGIRGPRKRC